MNLYNTLSHKVEPITPINDNEIRMYSCGPTVYDHIHIGNLASFIYADTLHRALKLNNFKISHVMNITDVDDKTINKGLAQYPDLEPLESLKKLTQQYTKIFFDDMKLVGNDVANIKFVYATETIKQMQNLIIQMYQNGIAYITEDGVYFSIAKYRASGKKYGQLLEITESNTSESRISNDEYGKESPHDFALWKTRKNNEPFWKFSLGNQELDGRPGWHIECSAMSQQELGIPFDIHTGGIDLIFPHHENEIAQSTSVNKNHIFSKVFFHNEHMLIDGKKMSKSLNNFFTLKNLTDKGYDPLAFRLMVLQSHYRNQNNFTFRNIQAAQDLLKKLQHIADRQFQPLNVYTTDASVNNLSKEKSESFISRLTNSLLDDLNTPQTMEILAEFKNYVDKVYIDEKHIQNLKNVLNHVDLIFNLDLTKRKDISNESKIAINKRNALRDTQDWQNAGKIRDDLHKQGIGLNDTPHGSVWYRL